MKTLMFPIQLITTSSMGVGGRGRGLGQFLRFPYFEWVFGNFNFRWFLVTLILDGVLATLILDGFLITWI